MEAALRGDETPLRVDSITVNVQSPPHANSVRPPVPQHVTSSTSFSSSSTSTNGRHGSSRSRNEPRPPIPMSRTASREKDLAPPLPNRVVSPTTSRVLESPVSMPSNRSTSPGQRDGPPLPQRGSLRSAKHPRSGEGAGGSVHKPPPQSSERLEPRNVPVIGGGSSGGAGGSVSRTSLPTPPSRPFNKPQLPGKPKTTTLPSKPALVKKPANLGQQHGSSGGGRGRGADKVVSVPSPDGMTPRQMIDFFLSESPAVISNIQDGVGSIPTLLDDLVTFGEAIADHAKGRSVHFRIEMSKFRSGLGNLKKFANVSWYNSVGQIIEEIDRLVSGLNILSQNLSE